MLFSVSEGWIRTKKKTKTKTGGKFKLATYIFMLVIFTKMLLPRLKPLNKFDLTFLINKTWMKMLILTNRFCWGFILNVAYEPMSNLIEIEICGVSLLFLQ